MSRPEEELGEEWEPCPEPRKCIECKSLLVQSKKKRKDNGRPLDYKCLYCGEIYSNRWDYWGRKVE